MCSALDSYEADERAFCCSVLEDLFICIHNIGSKWPIFVFVDLARFPRKSSQGVLVAQLYFCIFIRSILTQQFMPKLLIPLASRHPNAGEIEFGSS